MCVCISWVSMISSIFTKNIYWLTVSTTVESCMLTSEQKYPNQKTISQYSAKSLWCKMFMCSCCLSVMHKLKRSNKWSPTSSAWLYTIFLRLLYPPLTKCDNFMSIFTSNSMNLSSVHLKPSHVKSYLPSTPTFTTSYTHSITTCSLHVSIMAHPGS